MVHIYGHSWAIRWGKPGEERMVKVYSNCSEVELFLNGKSMGVKKRNIQDFPATGFHWDVQYTAGENELRAVGKSSGETIVDTIHQKYVITQWSTPEKLELKIVPIDGNSAWIVAQLNDAKGNCCLDAKNKVEFGVTGDARLIENQGTTSGSRKVELCNGVAKIKVMFENPNWVASVKSNGVKTAFCLPDKFVTDINK
jgi:beta-galactosidase